MLPIKKFLTIISLMAAVALPLTAPVSVAAIDEESRSAACEGIGAVGGDCDESAGNGISDLISAAVNILSWIIGVAAVIMIIVGGLKYVASGGDSNAISSAKNTILYAIIGLAIAALAQGIVQFVLKETTPGGSNGAVELE